MDSFTFDKMKRTLFFYLFCIFIVTGFVLLQQFHTQKLYEFKSETSEGVAGILYFHDQPVDTISMNRFQTNDDSAVYIEFVKYNHDPPYDDWGAVYGSEGNYRVFHGGRIIPAGQLPYLNHFSSPRLIDDTIVYWGFENGKVYGFRTELNTLDSDSVFIFGELIGTDFKYTYDFPVPKDSLFLFRTTAGDYDTVWVDFERLEVSD